MYFLLIKMTPQLKDTSDHKRVYLVVDSGTRKITELNDERAVADKFRAIKREWSLKEIPMMEALADVTPIAVKFREGETISHLLKFRMRDEHTAIAGAAMKGWLGILVNVSILENRELTLFNIL